MKILFIYDGEYPWDIRVEKLCNTFIACGHEVHLICRNAYGKPRRELYKGIHLRRISYISGGKAINFAWTFPAFFSPIWLYEIFQAIKEIDFDLIVVRDLPMALSAVLARKLYRIPTILDMAECYPEMLRCTWKFERFKAANILIRNPYVADLVEAVAMKMLDGVFVMIEESRNRLLNKGVDARKLFIVSNTPDPERFALQPVVSESSQNTTGAIKLIYVGLVNSSRGLDTVIKAVETALEQRFIVELSIVGDGKARRTLENYVADRNLQNHVRFLGWIGNELIPDYINGADVCIVPHHRCSHWDHTIPNKLFDYMAARKPVIVSDVVPMKRIVEAVECGYSYRDYDVDDLVAKLKLLQDHEIRLRLGMNGRSAVERSYNWANEEKMIQQALATIVG